MIYFVLEMVMVVLERNLNDKRQVVILMLDGVLIFFDCIEKMVVKIYNSQLEMFVVGKGNIYFFLNEFFKIMKI